MSDVKWIKVDTAIFENRKIKLIEALPQGDTMMVIWFKLLVLAGTTNDNGLIYVTKNVPYDEQMLATAIGKPLEVVRTALNIFFQYEMIVTNNGTICIHNWSKYQSIDRLDKLKEQNRSRVANYREKQKQIPKITKADMEMEEVDIMELQRQMFGKKEDKSIDVESIFKEAGI